MRCISRWPLLAVALCLGGPAASAQVAAGVARPVRLEVTTTSAEARTSFMAGVENIANPFPARGTAQLKRAIELDPVFGLARVIYGTSAIGLTTAQRNEEIERGMADAAKATTGELLVATAYREGFRQNAVGARAILLSAGGSGSRSAKDPHTQSPPFGASAAVTSSLTRLPPARAPMVKEAKAAGQYKHETMGRSYDRISIVTVRKIVEESKRLEIPMSLEVLAAARREADAEQVEWPSPSRRTTVTIKVTPLG